jgi:hypothetical protein
MPCSASAEWALCRDCTPVAKQFGIEFGEGLRRFGPGKVGGGALFHQRVPILLSLSGPIGALDSIPKSLRMVAIVYESASQFPHWIEVSDNLS